MAPSDAPGGFNTVLETHCTCVNPCVPRLVGGYIDVGMDVLVYGSVHNRCMLTKGYPVTPNYRLSGMETLCCEVKINLPVVGEREIHDIAT